MTSKKKAKKKKRVFADLKGKASPKKKEKDFNPKTWDEAESEGAPEDPEAGPSEKLKYPSPKANKIFRARWEEYIDDVAARDNFKKGHLSQLEILCNLYVELESLEKYLKMRGKYSYLTVTRNGDQWKLYPEVAQKNRTLAEIRNYSKTLGLVLVKDKEMNDGDEENEWE